MKTTWIVLGSAFTAVVLVAGAFQVVVFGVPWLGDSVIERDTYTEEIDKIVIAADSSDFLIRGSGRSDVLVSRELTWHSDRPRSEESVSGGVLTITPIDCEGRGTCSIDYTIEVPADVDLEVQASSGDIETLSLAGPQKLHTDSGDIEVHKSRGPLDADASSGDIEVVTDQPSTVTANASSGDIEIMLPRADYNVTTSAGSGDVVVTVARDDDSPYVVTASTGSGDITIVNR
jgi:hypothetical protein